MKKGFLKRTGTVAFGVVASGLVTAFLKKRKDQKEAVAEMKEYTNYLAESREVLCKFAMINEIGEDDLVLLSNNCNYTPIYMFKNEKMCDINTSYGYSWYVPEGYYITRLLSQAKECYGVCKLLKGDNGFLDSRMMFILVGNDYDE